MACGELDEQFHATLVRAAGNAEMARVHWDVTEHIRIVRRLDFTRGDRIEATYQEHAKILRAVMQRKPDAALLLLRSHIEQSKAEVARSRCMHSSKRAGGCCRGAESEWLRRCSCAGATEREALTRRASMGGLAAHRHCPASGGAAFLASAHLPTQPATAHSQNLFGPLRKLSARL